MSLATPDLHPAVPGASALAATVTAGSGAGCTISATDSQGTCRLRLQNDSTTRGPVISTVGLDIVDFGFLNGSGVQRIIRFEGRGTGPGYDTNEWHIGGTNLDNPTLSIGDTRLSHRSTHLGFYAATPVVKATVTGSKGANAALASLMTALSNLGLVTDSTT